METKRRHNMIAKRCFLFILLAAALTGTSQDKTMSDVLRDNIVTIRNDGTGETGSGFIIGLVKGKVLILTASHVVNKSPTVEVEISGQEGRHEAKVEEQNEFFDVALLTVQLASFEWKPYSYVTNVTAGDPVYIMSVLRNKEVMPSDGPGIVSDLDNENLVAKLRGVEHGDSGTPLLSNNGVVGMVFTRSPVQAVSILLLKKLVTGDWKYPWQLVEKSLYRAPAKEIPPPDLEKENVIDIANVSTDGDCAQDIKNVTDHDIETYWSCAKEGWKHLYFHFNGLETVRKIKIYFSDSYLEDLPKGEIGIPALKKSFKLEKRLSTFVEKEAKGSWYIYDLGNYYSVGDIKVSFKVKKDVSTDKITEVKIFEIKIVGPKS